MPIAFRNAASVKRFQLNKHDIVFLLSPWRTYYYKARCYLSLYM